MELFGFQSIFNFILAILSSKEQTADILWSLMYSPHVVGLSGPWQGSPLIQLAWSVSVRAWAASRIMTRMHTSSGIQTLTKIV